MRTLRAVIAVPSLSAAAMLGCRQAEPVASPALGEPLAALDDAGVERFRAGIALFNRVFTPEEGLGPLFNENQCSACHTLPATGGTGEQSIVRASHFTPPGTCDPLVAEGGENVRTRSTPRLRARGIERQELPSRATERARFSVPFIFGSGLVEAIPEDEILARADPDDLDGDGISGRPGRDAAGRLGRFGHKADHATIRSFVESAAYLEMGLTSPARPRDRDADGNPYPADVDPVADPELSQLQVDALVDFVRFLAPPGRRLGEAPEDRRMIERGAEVFRNTGCTACHVPSMRTGRSDVAALDRKEVHLYSDLLLHDMGAGLVNVCSPGASPTELRTAPLMGLGYRNQFLHDGRASDLPEAILLHGGEATPARERFRRLTESELIYLLRFLRSL